jgi:uncharacterized membrane protein
MVDSSLRNRHGLRMLSPLPQDGEGRPTAILLILAAAFVFALSDTAAKFVVGQLPPLEVHWFRSVVVLVLSGAVILRRSGLGAFRTAHPVLQTVRGLCVMGASLLFLSGLVYLPVADASAINFVWPLLITVFSVVLLKEQVGLRRALATAAGFLGMLVIMRPGSGAFHPAAVFPLGAAVVWDDDPLVGGRRLCPWHNRPALRVRHADIAGPRDLRDHRARLGGGARHGHPCLFAGDGVVARALYILAADLGRALRLAVLRLAAGRLDHRGRSDHCGERHLHRASRAGEARGGPGDAGAIGLVHRARGRQTASTSPFSLKTIREQAGS